MTEMMDTTDLNDPELSRRIHELRKTDNVTSWYYLAREYLFIAAAVGCTIGSYYLIAGWGLSWLWAAPITIVCIFAVGAGQHRLATLTHEASHYMLFRNRLLNELVSEWFCMYPVLGQTHPYRVQHLGHHQYPNDPDRDPDWTQLAMSGHRFTFPMTQWQFLWHCVIKQLLWPPLPIRYILARARFVVDQGEKSPYRLKRRSKPMLKIVGALFLVGMVAALTVSVWREDAFLLAVLPTSISLATLAFFAMIPANWFGEYFIQSDLSPRTQALMRTTYYSLVWPALGWLTLWTGMPWWLFYLVLWIVPLGTSFALFMILRQLVQHGNADQGRLTNTRNFEINPIISFAVFPIGNDYHLPHHLFPMVPHYNLRKAHDLLMKKTSYQQGATLVEGYFWHRTQPSQHPTVLELMTRPMQQASIAASSENGEALGR